MNEREKEGIREYSKLTGEQRLALQFRLSVSNIPPAEALKVCARHIMNEKRDANK